MSKIYFRTTVILELVTDELGMVCLAGRTVDETLEENFRAMRSEESCFGRLSKANKLSQEEEEPL